MYCSIEINGTRFYGICAEEYDDKSKVLTTHGYINHPSNEVKKVDFALNPALFKRLKAQLLVDQL